MKVAALVAGMVAGADTIDAMHLLRHGKAQRQIPALVSARQSGLSRLEAGELGLEEVFVDLVGGDRR